MTIDIAPTIVLQEPLTLEEKVDIRAGKLMCALSRYVPSLELLVGLDKYLKAATGGSVPVQMVDKGIGRLQISALQPNKSGEMQPVTMLTQSNHWNYVKAAICESTLTDMDMVCCHPTLLVQIFEHCGQQVPVLTRYIKDRDKVQKQTGLCKRLFKKYLLSVLYYPHADDAAVKRKLQKYGLSKEPALLTKLRAEIKTASARVLELYPCYTKAAVESKGDDYFNLPGVALSLLAQTAEKKCVLALYRFWEERGVHVSALIHDGLHVDKEAATLAMLPLAAEFIREQTGYSVELVYKPWEHLPEYLESTIAVDTVQSGDFAIQRLDGRLKRCNDRVFFRDDEHKWHCDQKHVQRLVTNAVSRMHIFDADYRSLSRQHHTMQQISSYVYANAPDDPQFLTRMYHETLLKLPFTDGYYCFKEKVFV